MNASNAIEEAKSDVRCKRALFMNTASAASCGAPSSCDPSRHAFRTSQMRAELTNLLSAALPTSAAARIMPAAADQCWLNAAHQHRPLHVRYVWIAAADLIDRPGCACMHVLDAQG